LASPERQALLDALVRHRWQPGPAAQALGISRATLYRRVKQHGIEMPRAKREPACSSHGGNHGPAGSP